MDKAEEAVDGYAVKAVFVADPLLQPELREKLQEVCRSRGIDLINYGPQFYESENLTLSPERPRKSHGDKHIIPFSPPDITEREIGEVVEALRSGWITTGPRTKLLERRLAAYIETGRADVDTEQESGRWSNRVVCLNSATASEELNFRILGIREGDEVIVPAYTYTASASSAVHCGATLKFVDIQKDGDPATHLPEMDYDKLEAAIGPKTKAVVTVDLGGIVCDYDRVFEIVERKRGLFTPLESDGTPLGDLSSRIQKALGRAAVVADSAHALGASRVFRGKKTYCGAIADFTDFSFHAVKNFTTAEGGASTWKPIEGVDNAEIYKFYQLLSLHGQNKDALAKSKGGSWEYDIIGPWYKCNMTDIMAAIGLRQLDRYPGLLERRVEILKKYCAVCDELGISHLVHHVEGMDSSNHLFLIRLPGFSAEQRNSFIEKLVARGVSANVHYKPLPMMTAYRSMGWDIADFPNTYDYYHNLVTLPLHTLLSDEDVDYVCETVKAVYREMRA
ncbi:MAG: DegT/DnrJ/EryC1/StrS family aminotransferase [Oscillospiraceae bacterium]|nr:DegT/DnrJ/EryC1/StrS family aminotransferase [Oscillospiraceae bacterium]